MRVTIEKAEGGLVVLETEDGGRVTAPAELFDDPAEGAVYMISRDMQEEERRRESIAALAKKLFAD